MSDDENSKQNPRFNKFENSTKLEIDKYSLKNSQSLKRCHSKESLFPYNAKRSNSDYSDNYTHLNKTWPANASSASPVNVDSKYSANNRLKKLRHHLEESKLKNPLIENIGEPIKPQLQEKKENILRNNGLQNSDFNYSMDNAHPSTIKSFGEHTNFVPQIHNKVIKSPTPLINFIDTSALLSNENELPKTNESVTKSQVSSPVNIYKDLDKWVTGSSDNKSSKRGLANERLQRLKKHVNNSDKDYKSKKESTVKSNLTEIKDPKYEPISFNNIAQNSEANNSHVSPLLRGLKRSATTEVFDYSNPKKIAQGQKTNKVNIQSRSMRLVQTALCNENGKHFMVNKGELVAPVLSNKLDSEKSNFKSTTLTTNCLNKESLNFSVNNVQSNKKETNGLLQKECTETPTTSVTQVVEDSGYTEKMKMTANWVATHNFGDLSQSKSFSEEFQAVKATITKGESNVNLNEVEDMEWTNAEPDEESLKGIEDSKHENESQQISEMTVKTDNTSKSEEKNCTEGVHKDPDKHKNLCIVVDTNIFIKNLSKLKDILNMKISGPEHPVLYIPWMVVTELDYIKDSTCSNEKLKKDVMNSVKFLNTALSEKSEKVVAQTVFDMQNQKQLGTSADDKIMSCCLYAKENMNL